MTHAMSPPLLLPGRTVHVISAGVGVASSGLAGGAISGEIGTFVGTAVGVIALLMSIAAAHGSRIEKAKAAGRKEREDEVQRLTEWMEFYRQQWAFLLQKDAGVPATGLPPMMPMAPQPPGPPPAAPHPKPHPDDDDA